MLITSSAGRPTVSSTITMVTKPACGIPAAPMLAAVAVTLKFNFYILARNIKFTLLLNILDLISISYGL